MHTTVQLSNSSKQIKRSRTSIFIQNKFVQGFSLLLMTIGVLTFIIANSTLDKPVVNLDGAYAEVGVVTAGAENNYDLLPAVPQLPTTMTVSTGDELRSALASALSPGAVIELNDGMYTGGQFLVGNSSRGTSMTPIIIRAKNVHKAIISECGSEPGYGYERYCFRLEGTSVILTGLTFTNTKWSNVNVLGSGNRVSNNRFIDAGISVPNPGDFKNSIIGSFDSGALNVDALVDNNYILRPKNIPFAISESSYGITISHNTIEGPNEINTSGSRESNAFKIGCCDSANVAAYQANPIIIQFNTIKDFGVSDPYFGSSKVPFTRFVYNRVLGTLGNTNKSYVWETRGKLSESNVVIGNFFEDGTFVFEDSSQTIKNNTVFTKTGWYGVGPLVFTGTQGVVNAYGVFDPAFYTAVTNADVQNNVFVAKINVATINNAQLGSYSCTLQNNLLKDNYFLSPNSAGFDGCISSTLAAGSGNNTIGNLSLSPVDVNALNASAPYFPEFTRYLTGSPSTPTTPTPPPPTTTTPPPPTTPPLATCASPADVVPLSSGSFDQSRLVFAGDWKTNPNASSYQAAECFSNIIGASYSFSFTGTGFMLYGLKSGGHGMADVSVDGASVGVIDSYASVEIYNSQLFAHTGLALGAHSVTVTIVADKNSASGATYMNIDKVDIQNVDLPTTPTTPPTPPPAPVNPQVSVTIPSGIVRINGATYDLQARSVALSIVSSGVTGLTATINGITTALPNNGQLQLPARNGSYSVVIKDTSKTWFSQTIRIRHPDFNRDGSVDINDLNSLSSRVGRRYRSSYAIYDLNLDGRLNSTDISILQSLWGQ